MNRRPTSDTGPKQNRIDIGFPWYWPGYPVGGKRKVTRLEEHPLGRWWHRNVALGVLPTMLSRNKRGGIRDRRSGCMLQGARLR